MALFTRTTTTERPLVARILDAEATLSDKVQDKNDESVRLAELAASAKREADIAHEKRVAVSQAYEILSAANVDI